MKPIKVNADYERVLFEKKESPKVVNQSIEFLAMYLEERPLFTEKNYSNEFLEHVKRIKGTRPVVVNKGDWENWWGQLKNLPLEWTLNSKEFVVPFSPDTQLITSMKDLVLSPGKTYLAKSPYGMSGQNFLTFTSSDLKEVSHFLEKCRKLIIEPLYKRVHDFSHYVFSDGQIICYQNLVDHHFQYKGTLFKNLLSPDLNNLKFYQELQLPDWEEFEKDFRSIVDAVHEAGGVNGFSVDSFTYLEDGKLEIRTASEINYRKTMGLMAWLLSRKYFNDMSWSLFVLGKSLGRPDAFSYVDEQLKTLKDCIHLSPGDTRFEAFLIAARSHEEGIEKYKELRRLLPDCQFSINI
jgi:hypothetical protein